MSDRHEGVVEEQSDEQALTALFDPDSNDGGGGGESLEREPLAQHMRGGARLGLNAGGGGG